jgi:hypothetical protein
MLLILLFIIVGVIYFIYVSGSEKEYQRQLKNDPVKKESLEEYNTQSILFNLYKNYLYKNIDYFKGISNYEIIKNKIENDFPNYGNGILGEGIIEDFSRYKIIHVRDENRIRLGKTFHIISIAYKNYNIFLKNIYNSEFTKRYVEGGFYSDFGDDITIKIFYVELSKTAKLFFGLSIGGYKLDNYVKKHNFKTEKEKVYLFTEFCINNNSINTYPHFEIINLKMDLSVEEYHDFFNKSVKICHEILNNQ